MDDHRAIAHNQLAMLRRPPHHSIAAAVTAAISGVLMVAATVASTAAGASPAHGSTRAVIVQTEPGAAATVRRAVQAVGGRVTRDLPIVNGFAAAVPAA